MTIKVAINGFGRIGRMVLRAAMTSKFQNIQIVAINDLLEPEYLAYMLKYDSVHGRFNGEIEVFEHKLVVNGQSIRLTAERDPSQLKWSDVDVDVVVDCTGLFLTQESCQKHLDAGAKKVVQSAPSKDDTPMFVYGVNHETYQGQRIVSAASCTTNALAPIVKVLNDQFGIKRGLMTTVHAATATQKTVDSISSKDWRGGRGVFANIIPSSTGAAKVVGKIIPSLNEKLTGMAFRVPTSDVSVVDLTVELLTPTCLDSIEAAMRTASESGPLKDVLALTAEPVVSTDFIGQSYASIFDADACIQLDSTFVKVIAWYDNEYGYTCNLMRLVQYIAKQQQPVLMMRQVEVPELAVM